MQYSQKGKVNLNFKEEYVSDGGNWRENIWSVKSMFLQALSDLRIRLEMQSRVSFDLNWFDFLIWGEDAKGRGTDG